MSEKSRQPVRLSGKCPACLGEGVDGMKTGTLDLQPCKDCGGSGWANPAARIQELEDVLRKAMNHVEKRASDDPTHPAADDCLAQIGCDIRSVLE